MRVAYLIGLWVVSAFTLGLQATLGAREAMFPISILLMIPFAVMASEDIQRILDNRRLSRRATSLIR